MKRFVAIAFRHLLTDQLTARRPELRGKAFVLAAPERGRMVIRALSPEAASEGITEKMVLADARVLYPALEVFDYEPDRAEKLLKGLAEWCLRYTPLAGIDLPDGLVLDASGCTHLWKGEKLYIADIIGKLKGAGYDVRAAMADTIGTAWALARYGKNGTTVASDEQLAALMPLPPHALRLDPVITERMQKLGLTHIGDFIDMPRTVLRRRFGDQLSKRIGQALGTFPESLEPIRPLIPYVERLPCFEPVCTRKAIEMALETLLESICLRLQTESKGLRKAVFRSFRMDGREQWIAIGTGRPSRDRRHLFRLFSEKIGTIAPGLGIELFILEAPVAEHLDVQQEKLWNDGGAYESTEIGNLLDRIAGRVGKDAIRRYLPDEHHWPERSIKRASSYWNCN
ncbi:DNA polymerase Y family protein [Olivibacter sp. CPCC 100613]|uniref:Y-family DNA polymerase n=1 Tax=Olivibacter sp. CPCC 100613 TaxID=3079931 RepID=UPI002FF964AE